MKRTVRYFCLAYTALLALGIAISAIIGSTTTYGDVSGVGCNFYDALFYGINCRGFVGATMIEWLAGFALVVLQISAMTLLYPLMVVLALPLWAPVGVVAYRALKRRGKSTRSGVEHFE